MPCFGTSKLRLSTATTSPLLLRKNGGGKVFLRLCTEMAMLVFRVATSAEVDVLGRRFQNFQRVPRLEGGLRASYNLMNPVTALIRRCWYHDIHTVKLSTVQSSSTRNNKRRPKLFGLGVE